MSTFDKREYRGMEIAAGRGVRRENKRQFRVVSESDSSLWYEVRWMKKRWVCDCEDHAKTGRKCKHIYAVAYHQLEHQAVLGVWKEALRIRCPRCGGDQNLKKQGFHYNRDGPIQRYSCQKCKIRFIQSSGGGTSELKAAAIASALDLYFRGLSLRQVAEHLSTYYGTAVTHATIYNWLKRYVDLVSRYFSTAPAKTSERWHADETLVRVNGRHMVLWGLLDSDTRLLLAAQLTGGRGKKEACTLLRKGMRSSTTPPLEVVTDGLPSYDEAIAETSKRTPTLVHIQGPLIQGHNNKVERLWRTVNARARTTGRFVKEKNARRFVEGFQIHYNYVKSHRALGDRTPAEKAGLATKKMRWTDLIEKAEQRRQTVSGGF